MSKIQEVINTLPQVGQVEWIGVRPQHRGVIEPVASTQISAENGLEGDHYSKQGGKRQVTLIQAEHLAGVARMLGKDVEPGHTRRNIVVSGINLLAFKDRQFLIGDAVLEMTGLCHPCTRMEENLGAGGYNAMRGHGGITAKVIEGGTIRLSDAVSLRKNDG
jgi:MOSC domain-containing protein YiiM